MKTCPTCDKRYEDRFHFCLIDGDLLVAADDESADEPSEVSEITAQLGDSDLVQIGPALDDELGFEDDEEVTRMTLEPDIPAEAHRPDGMGPLQAIRSSELEPVKSGEIVLEAKLPPKVIPDGPVEVAPSRDVDPGRHEAATIEPAGAPTMELSGLREMAQRELNEERAVVGEAIDAVLARGEEKLPDTAAAPAVGVLASDGRELHRLVRPRLTWLWIVAAVTVFLGGIVVALLVADDGPPSAAEIPVAVEPRQVRDTKARQQPPEAQSTKTEPAKAEPVKTEPAKTEPAKTEPAKAEPVKTEPAKTEPAKTKPAKTEPAKTEPAKTEPAKTEPAKTEPAKTEPAKPHPKKRVQPARRKARRKARRPRRGQRARRRPPVRRSLDKATIDPFAE